MDILTVLDMFSRRVVKFLRMRLTMVHFGIFAGQDPEYLKSIYFKLTNGCVTCKWSTVAVMKHFAKNNQAKQTAHVLFGIAVMACMG